jgi:hypothetical protein
MEVPRVRRIARHDLLRHAVGVSLGLCRRHAGLQPPHQREVPAGARFRRELLRQQAHRHPQLRAVQVAGEQRKLEVAWHHTDDHVRLAVEQDFHPQHIGIAVEPALPRLVAQHRYQLLLLVLLLRENAAHQRRHAEHGKHRRRHACGGNLRGLADTRQLKAQAGESAQRRKRARVAPIDHHLGSRHWPGIGMAPVGSGHLIAERHQPFGMREGKRPQKDPVDNREDRGRRADAERQHEHRRQREPRRLPQLPQDQFEIGEHKATSTGMAMRANQERVWPGWLSFTPPFR